MTKPVFNAKIKEVGQKRRVVWWQSLMCKTDETRVCCFRRKPSNRKVFDSGIKTYFGEHKSHCDPQKPELIFDTLINEKYITNLLCISYK